MSTTLSECGLPATDKHSMPSSPDRTGPYTKYAAEWERTTETKLE